MTKDLENKQNLYIKVSLVLLSMLRKLFSIVFLRRLIKTNTRLKLIREISSDTKPYINKQIRNNRVVTALTVIPVVLALLVLYVGSVRDTVISKDISAHNLKVVSVIEKVTLDKFLDDPMVVIIDTSVDVFIPEFSEKSMNKLKVFLEFYMWVILITVINGFLCAFMHPLLVNTE